MDIIIRIMYDGFFLASLFLVVFIGYLMGFVFGYVKIWHTKGY
jgi:hypothetical protein